MHERTRILALPPQHKIPQTARAARTDKRHTQEGRGEMRSRQHFASQSRASSIQSDRRVLSLPHHREKIAATCLYAIIAEQASMRAEIVTFAVVLVLLVAACMLTDTILHPNHAHQIDIKGLVRI